MPGTSLPRRVEPELLDLLDCDDPRARRSRRDLRRVNRAMGTVSIVLRALDRALPSSPRTILEVGCGDGWLMRRLAARRARQWPEVQVTLLDRQPVVASECVDDLRRWGWVAKVVTADAFEWLARPHALADAQADARPDAQPASQPRHWDVILANLVLHHFSNQRLVALLAAIAASTGAFVACEPRRDRLSLAGSRLLAFIGAGEVTRHDAPASVRAGFAGTELSALWPAGDWRLRECRAGAFSHCLCATRASASGGRA